MKSILVVDDEHSVRLSLRSVFEPDYRVLLAEDGPGGLAAVRDQAPDIAIVDLVMPGMSGDQLIPLLRQEDPELLIIVLSALHETASVVRAVQAGANQYLTKPFDVHELRLAVEMALRQAGRSAELTTLEAQLARWYDPEHITGESAAWQQVLVTADRAAASRDTTILLCGESGTGKELLARRLHRTSPRREGPMVPIHCAAIPEALLESELFGHEKGSFTGAAGRRRGSVELADTGTLFLDEIGEMPAPMQSKLLRFLQDHEFSRVGGGRLLHADVRIVAATNRDLEQAIADGSFREDLYYRLNVVRIELPPLRARLGDIPLLVEHHVRKFGREHHASMQGVTPAAMVRLEQYRWPGNVRELRNVIERAVVLYGDQSQLEEAHLPREIVAPAASSEPLPAPSAVQFPLSLQDEVKQLEERLIHAAVRESGGNLSKAAVLLGTTRRVLKYKVDQYGMEV